ncbi:MAG: zinc metalloprotease HtpX [Aquificae bacterium]|nr:zinc metalloprotease HtpX [Aquificota bacterium]
MSWTIRTVLLLGVLTGLLMALGGLIGGTAGMLVGLIFAGIMNFISYWFSDKIVLSMYGAREIPYEEAPWLHDMVAELAQRANMPKPPIYLVPMEQPNAFATGRGPGHAAVGVTRGILELLDREELKGVLAHELAHIKNRDVLVASIAATIAGAIGFLANMAQWALFFGGFNRDEEEEGGGILEVVSAVLMIVLVPIIATIIQLAISRAREYLADETGAKICGCPEALARALKKIHEYVTKIPAPVNPGTAHLFIENPLKGEGLLELLSTHPPTEKRIERLCKLAREMGKECII